MNENKNNNQIEEKSKIETILKLSVTASLATMGIVLSTVVIFFPNIEFISVTIFIISLLFGLEYGLISAISIPIVYEFIVTPIYGSSGYLVLFKLICYVLLALLTGLSRKYILKLTFWELGIVGVVFALFYDVFTTFCAQMLVLQRNLTFSIFLTILLFGIPFTITHVIGNFIMFSLTKTFLNLIVTTFHSRGIKFLKLPHIIDIKEHYQINVDDTKGVDEN